MSGRELPRQITRLIEVTDQTMEVYDTIKDIRGLPEAFQEVRKWLPLVEQTLREAKTPAKKVEFTNDTNMLGTRMDNCEEKADNLLEIFQKIARKSTEEYVPSVYRSIAVKLGKHRVETLMGGILEDLLALVAHHMFQAVMQKQVEPLDKAKQELANVSPSLSESDLDEQPGTATQHGDGNRQFNNFGIGPQKNVDGNYFEAKGDQHFVTNIKHIYAENRASISDRPETPPKPFASIPFSRDPDFVNRGNIVDQIDERCSKPAARVALVGMGGVGKSQLAIEFAHRIAAEQPDVWVFWVHAGTQARVEEGFRMIADAVKLPGRNQAKANIPQIVYHWLSNERNGRWIMILDSADDRDVFYGPTSGDARNGRPFVTYLPQSRNGSVIITTRNKDLASRLTDRPQNRIEVGPMARTDALTLLEKKLGSLADTDVADDLVQVLDFVPLAISQAAAYIRARAPRSSPKKYLAEFRESECKKGRLLEYDGGDLRRDGGASNAILTTWQISFDYIRSKQPSAADLLSLMSFFDRQGIPGWVLNIPRISKEAMQGRSQNKDSTLELDDSSSATDDDTDDGADDDIDGGFEDDVAMLRDYCLITTNEVGNEFEMHGLVQLSTRRWLEVFGREEVFKKQYIERLTASFPTGQYENWATCRSLFAHVQVAFGYRPSEDTLEIWATLLHNGGWYAWSQGVYEVAQQMLGKARKVRKRRLGKDDMATLASTSIFAVVLSNQGRWEEAEKLEVQVMETRKTKLGADHPSTLTSMGNLASTFWNQGRWEEAEKLFVQVMETSKTKLGANHPDTLTSMNNLAFTWKDQGRPSDAIVLMEECSQARQRVLGAGHPDTLSSLAAIAEWSS